MFRLKAGLSATILIFMPSALASQDDSGGGSPAPDYERWNRQEILSALGGLQVSPESECEADGVESSTWAGLQDRIAELHDGPLSPYDGIVFPNYHYVQIEHIVARKEADESGLCNREEEEREQFAADLLNLTLAPGSLNASKGDSDAHDLETAETSLFRENLTEHGLCWWAAQTVRVKAKHMLSVDADEKSSLSSILEDCVETQVYRPKLTAGSDWVFRTEFLDELEGDHEISQCSDPVADASHPPLAASAANQHLASIACVQPVDPRAARIAAVQNACIQVLESKNLSTTCTNIAANCPDVDPILKGEPLYGSGRDRDSDGVACEDL